ncbi:hypothetical protein X729_28910 [Mesorhizobium sp. L103C131B0]|nr:hypothetical protein X729_28910 [Mesorhizobium sp. L103C131B0]
MMSACGSNGSVANLFVSEHGKKNASAVEEHVMFKGRHFDQAIGFKWHANDVVILSGIEMIHMMGKRQARYAYKAVDRCFDLLAA